MAAIIQFGNQKGGVGKSILTILSATALSQAPFDYKVIVLDCDNQLSIIKHRTGDLSDFTGVLPYAVQPMTVATLESEISSLNANYDIIFIDSPGRLDDANDNLIISRVLNYVDLLIIPFVPAAINLESTIEYLKFALKVKARRPDNRPLEIRGLINKLRIQRKTSAEFLKEQIADIRSVVNINFFESYIKDLVIFEDADTIKSLYAKDENLKGFIDELNKILTHG